MLTQYEREGLVAQHQAALRREAEDSRRAALLHETVDSREAARRGRRSARERVAAALVALAARLAPASQGAPARDVVETGRSA